ncbi:MAG: PilZ domain-containing protein, partial [Candidatus Omnitrophica bacterium]|nr:PilZ domain-containing protein [Candidatus Omnitrophota bacterium]
MKNNLDERRKYLRLDTVNKIEVYLDRKFIRISKATVSAFTKNISVEGVCFFSEKPFPNGKRVRLEIYLPGEETPLHIRGQIRWVSAVKNKDKKVYEVGVKLFTVEENDAT